MCVCERPHNSTFPRDRGALRQAQLRLHLLAVFQHSPDISERLPGLFLCAGLTSSLGEKAVEGKQKGTRLSGAFPKPMDTEEKTLDIRPRLGRCDQHIQMHNRLEMC